MSTPALLGAEYSVIGTDDRFQIRARSRRPSTLLFPYSTICLLEGDNGSGTFRHRGTGTLIAPQVVLTAKHVLRGQTRMRVTPGADLSAAAHRRPASPSQQVAGSARFRADPGLDYGVIILPRPFTRPDRFMMLQPRGDRNTATLLTIAGYPCDKPFGTLWGHSGSIALTGVTANRLFYSIDTCPGHSGSPIWLLGGNGVRLLLGVHTTGAGGSNSRCPNAAAGRCLPTGAPVASAAGRNSGVRVTCRVIRFIQQQCRTFAVRGPDVDAAAMRRTCAVP